MKSPKRLYIFSYEYPYGKAETFLHNEIQILARTFAEVVIIPSRVVWNKDLVYGHVRPLPPNVTLCKENFSIRFFNLWLFFRLMVLPFKFSTKFSSKNFLAILKQSFKISSLIGFIGQKKLIHAEPLFYSYWKNESATAIAYLKNKRRINYAVSRAHREDLYEEFGGLKPFDDFVGQNIDLVFCISDHGKKYLLEKGFARDKVIVSRLGVYPTHVCSLYSFDSFNILSVSHVVPVKRVALIAKAVLKLKMKVRWVHIGGGPEFEMLQNIISSHNQEHITIELLGPKTNEEVYAYYRDNQVDLFLNVSFSEGLPVSIMEAYSFSVPCMACNVGGNAEIIDPSDAFLLSPQINENGLAKSLSWFYGKRNLWKVFRKNAFNIWKEEYNAVENYNDFVKTLIEAKC